MSSLFVSILYFTSKNPQLRPLYKSRFLTQVFSGLFLDNNLLHCFVVAGWWRILWEAGIRRGRIVNNRDYGRSSYTFSFFRFATFSVIGAGYTKDYEHQSKAPSNQSDHSNTQFSWNNLRCLEFCGCARESFNAWLHNSYCSGARW